MTHYFSFAPPLGHAINHETNIELLDDCIHVQFLKRVLHIIYRQSSEYPSRMILLLKVDLDAAYRRMHVQAEKSVKAMSIIDIISYLETKLPFRAVTGPSVFSTFRKLIFDLMNNLLSNNI